MTGYTLAVDPDTGRRQASASDPQASAWVSANAGSGKTYVLARRVKRLLLAGVDPSRILCLTFTKAAAANMANRVLGDLARWAALDDAALDGELRGLGAASVGARERARARRVFARALETPGGLKVQTIHAFCDALLHQFPFEAGVTAGFTVMDEAQAAELARSARIAVVRAGAADPDGVLGRALACVSLAVGEGGFDGLLQDVLKRRPALDQALPRLDAVEACRAQVREALGLRPGDTPEDVERRVLAEAHLPEGRWKEAATILEGCKVTDARRGALLRAAAALGDPRARAAAYDAIFRKEDGDFRAAIVTQDVAKKAPWLAEALKAELARLAALDATRRAALSAEVSVALAALARAAADRIDRAKAAGGLLDFADLVRRAAGLFAGARGSWVRWKLDRGIDHVLVDEAQDTSGEQWQVIDALVEEFFAGEGAAEALRTLFVVGDEKQSIFGFQGAEPRLFAEKRTLFGRAATAAGLRFHALPLQLSFRSSDAVLSAVDAVFAREAARAGLSATGEAPAHAAARRGAPGHVEIWPVPKPPGRVEKSGWRHALDAPSREDPRWTLATRIAREIAGWVATQSVMDAAGPRPLAAGDVMVLVRRRGTLFDALIRALKEAEVPVAGADRLVLVEHIAVMDLMALGDAVLLPENDLVLAALLKSPLIGLDEDALFGLAHNREGTLFAALQARRDAQPPLAEAWDRLAAWRARADRMRPYEFYARVLGADGGRRQIAARLGREAVEAADEFLQRALDYEKGHTPSLQGFLAWLRSSALEVKREMEHGRNEVRVMTVHNAKGLEAKVVVLPDTTGLAGAGHAVRLFEVPAADGTPLILWSPSKRTDVGPLAAARAESERLTREESNRLLYVAMTRAEERLVIAGHPVGNAKEPKPDCWYTLVHGALQPESAEEHDTDGAVRAWFWQRTPCPPHDPGGGSHGATAAPTRPAWADRPPPPAAATTPMVAPSRFADAGETDDARNPLEARRRGVLLHRLLQHLPDLPSERRESAAQAFLRREEPESAEDLLAEAAAVLALPALTPLLAPGSLAEVPVLGEVTLPGGGTVAVNGRIDRLAVTATSVHLLDYKSGTPPETGAPQPHLGQLALYARVLAAAFPGRAVHAAVLWTQEPRLDAISPAELDRALPAF